ncbi:hypothetical protein F4821DRAFT_237184 [Hypoxylon rubiginosum]|uniref:Uncharacterized protein n=1 Tax=Hypoxylon rubiginosum TaxID=110542 RepID=A0ACC0D2V9_9PEZI|nr:hypothetical protein F4821DRAFT_237184 [Hypoxylon rubiginosum]
MENIDSSAQNASNMPIRALLDAWRRCLFFEIISNDDRSIKKVGLVDSGSTRCFISLRAVKELELTPLPLRSKTDSLLNGFEGALNCQPIGFVYLKVRQPDLRLDTETLAFLVIHNNQHDLLLGDAFNHAHRLDLRIFDAVENRIYPQDWDKTRPNCDYVHVLIDGRSKSKRIFPLIDADMAR